jgi:hypothetical protein
MLPELAKLLFDWDTVTVSTHVPLDAGRYENDVEVFGYEELGLL